MDQLISAQLEKGRTYTSEEYKKIREEAKKIYGEQRTEFQKAGDEGEALAAEEIAHLKEISTIVVENAKRELEANELIEKSRQTLQYSDEKRVEFLKKVKSLRAESLEQDIELAKKEKEHALRVAKLSSDEPRVLKAQAEATVKILQLQSDYLSGNRRIDTQINTLNQEIFKRGVDAIRQTEDIQDKADKDEIEKRIKRAGEDLKLETLSGEERIGLQLKIGSDRLKLLDEEKKKEIETIKRAAQDRLIAEGGQDISDKAIGKLKSFQDQKLNVEKEYASKIIEQEKQTQAEVNATLLDSLHRDLAKRKLALFESQKELSEIDKRYADGEITTYEQYQRLRHEIEAKLQKQSIDLTLQNLQEELELRKSQGLLTIEQEQKIQEAILQVKENAYKRDIEGRRKAQEAITQLEQQAFATAQSIIENSYDRQDEKLKASIDERVNKLERAKEVELIIAGDNANAKLSIEQKYSDKEKAVQAEQNALQRKRAAAEQKLAAFEIFIRTSAAVLKAYAEVPFPYDSVVAAAYGSIGALQLAAVLTKPLPAFELGTDFAPGGLALVGEKGRERVTEPGGNTFYTPDRPTIMPIKRGSVVIPYEETVRELALSALQGVSNDQSFQPNTDGRIVKKLADIEYAIANKSTPIVNITREGLRLMVQKANERIIFLDQFYK